MYEIQVDKMTCGGCAGRVTEAVLALDESATVNVDLKGKLIRVTSTLGAAEVTRAISGIRYPATIVTSEA
jgi:copper chaperone